MTETVRTLPPAANFVLTHKIPCALLAMVMFTSVVWAPAIVSGIPLLAVIMALLGMTLHMLTPALFALVLFGGGLTYAIQVAAIASVGVAVVAKGLTGGVLFFSIYAILPILVAARLRYPGRIWQTAQYLALVMLLATLLALWAGASSQNVSMTILIGQLLAPFFNLLEASVPVGDAAMMEAAQQAKAAAIWGFPGMMAFSFWMMWWSNVLIARKIAIQYGFYHGDRSEMLHLRFTKTVGIAFMASLLLANMTGGSLQLIAVAFSIMLAGLLSLQGIAIAHLWLKIKNMQIAIIIMYIVVLIWSVMIIPFIIAGLLDIWFDYRRNMISVIGGK
ncbi:MAG: DUF2232 domain-containing protein [Mariprofundaceae bacterium]